MSVRAFDYLLAILLVAVLPLHAAREYRTLRARLEQQEPGVRMREYWHTIGLQWGLVGIVALLWLAYDRPGSQLGLALGDGTPRLVGASLTLLALVGFAVQWRAILRTDASGEAQLRAQLESAISVMPTTPAEYRVFRALAVTAGICEEILFRGFLIWFAAAFMPRPIAVFMTALAFGLAHLYQGKLGVLKTGLVGLAMGGLFVGTGSLLWPIILHAAMDLQGGAVGYRLMSRPATAEPQPAH